MRRTRGEKQGGLAIVKVVSRTLDGDVTSCGVGCSWCPCAHNYDGTFRRFVRVVVGMCLNVLQAESCRIAVFVQIISKLMRLTRRGTLTRFRSLLEE